MLEILKKKSMKASVIRVIIGLLITVGILAFTKLGILTYLKGPIEITSNMKLQDMEGKYVEFDAKYIVSEFVRESTKNTKTNVTKLKNIGYLVYSYDQDSFYGIRLSSAEQKTMDRMIEDYWDWASYAIDDVSSSIKVTGTVKKMSGKMLDFYNETMQDLQEVFEQPILDTAYPYCIYEGQVNGVDTIGMFVLTGIAVISLLYAIYIAIRGFGGKYEKHIKGYLENNPSVSMSHLEADFAAARNVGSSIWVGKRWTFYVEGIYAYIIENEKLAWAYYYQVTGKHSESKVKTFNANGEEKDINCTKGHADEILKIYTNEQPQMIIGYDKDLEKTFKKDRSTFLSYKYNQAKESKDNFYSGESGMNSNFNFNAESETAASDNRN